MRPINWAGIFVVVTTKLKEDGTLDEQAIAAGLERMIAHHVDGIVVLGTCGENALLTSNEKLAVLNISKNIIRDRVPLLSGLFEASTTDAIQFAKAAQHFGVQGLMTAPSTACKTEMHETVEYYRAIAHATDLSIMLLNDPRRTGIDLTPSTLDALRDEPNIIGIKEESLDTGRITAILTQFDDRYVVFSGDDSLLLECVLLGARGCISGTCNAFPREMIALAHSALCGNLDIASALTRILAPLLTSGLPMVQLIKLADNRIAGFSEQVRAPRMTLRGHQRDNALLLLKETMSALDKFWKAASN